MTQYVTLTVDIPTDALRDSILASVNKELARPSYSTHSGSAFQVIEAAVRRVLLNALGNRLPATGAAKQGEEC